jgi:hypothetical protein
MKSLILTLAVFHSPLAQNYLFIYLFIFKVHERNQKHPPLMKIILAYSFPITFSL